MHYLVRKFFRIIKELDITIVSDQQWPIIAENLIKDKSELQQKNFWLSLERELIAIEPRTGKCHKGNIYWRLALLYLSKDTLEKSLIFLEQAMEEDRYNLKREDTAAFLFYSVIKPLHNIVVSNPEVNKIFRHLPSNESTNFFTRLKELHDLYVRSQIYHIALPPDGWLFIEDEKRRKSISTLYFENLELLVSLLALPSYYSSIFSIGAINEGFIDEMFTKNNEALWKKFKENSSILKVINKEKEDYPLKGENYPEHSTFGLKIRALELLSIYKIKAVPDTVILQLCIINAYRNLIHPNRMSNFKFSVNRYIAAYLLSLIPDIAHYLWPENLKNNTE